MIISLTTYGEDKYGDVDVSISQRMPHHDPNVSGEDDSDFVYVRWDSSTKVSFYKGDLPWLKRVLKILESQSSGETANECVHD